MSRMFKVNGKTVMTINPIKGSCKHVCSYCYRKNSRAKRFYEGAPRFDAHALKPLGKNKVVFVASMNDMWGNWIPLEWIETVLEWCGEQDESNTFYFLTKNPMRYRTPSLWRELLLPDTYILGVTVESDIDAIAGKLSHAPPPTARLDAMLKLPPGTRKFISIEPIVEFSCSFAERIRAVAPEFVYLGMNNHQKNARLCEPSLSSTRYLIKQLRAFTKVREKTLREAV